MRSGGNGRPAISPITNSSQRKKDFRVIPYTYEEGDLPELWPRDERLGQLAERLMTLPTGCCYLKTPDGTEYHEVPYVPRYLQNPDTVLEYLQTANTLAIPPDEADRIIQQQEASFLERSRTDASPSKSDRAVIKAFADVQYLTVAQTAELTGRKESRMRERLRNLHFAGVLNRVTSAVGDERPVPLAAQPYVYFLGVKGGATGYRTAGV